MEDLIERRIHSIWFLVDLMQWLLLLLGRGGLVVAAAAEGVHEQRQTAWPRRPGRGRRRRSVFLAEEGGDGALRGRFRRSGSPDVGRSPAVSRGVAAVEGHLRRERALRGRKKPSSAGVAAVLSVKDKQRGAAVSDE